MKKQILIFTILLVGLLFVGFSASAGHSKGDSTGDTIVILSNAKKACVNIDTNKRFFDLKSDFEKAKSKLAKLTSQRPVVDLNTNFRTRPGYLGYIGYCKILHKPDRGIPYQILTQKDEVPLASSAYKSDEEVIGKFTHLVKIGTCVNRGECAISEGKKSFSIFLPIPNTLDNFESDSYHNYSSFQVGSKSRAERDRKLKQFIHLGLCMNRVRKNKNEFVWIKLKEEGESQ